MKEVNFKKINPSTLLKARNIYFLGIGGIGMSALARMMHARGKMVSGGDREESRIVVGLKNEGIQVFIGDDAKNITTDIDVMIYTIAIGEGNLEFDKALSLGIPLISYPEALGIVSKDFYTIAISGTHGKTTTTAMVGKVLGDAGRSPTIIVGSLLKDTGTNFIAGVSDLFVVEACEYRRSFLNLEPNILVITNIDNDHLDYYKDIYDIENAFQTLACKVPKNGYIVTNPRNESVARALKGVTAKVIDYTLYEDTLFDLQIPGKHNVFNAKAALAIADILKVERESALRSLHEFAGTWRRFEYKGKTESGALVYDDYGHHPTEIRATLQAAREHFPHKKLIVVFQPHLYSRTKLLFPQFVESFNDADEVIIAPVYAAREVKDENINERVLAQYIQKNNPNTQALGTFEEIMEYLKNHAGENDVIVTMGAGDIYKVGEGLIGAKK